MKPFIFKNYLVCCYLIVLKYCGWRVSRIHAPIIGADFEVSYMLPSTLAVMLAPYSTSFCTNEMTPLTKELDPTVVASSHLEASNYTFKKVLEIIQQKNKHQQICNHKREWNHFHLLFTV